MRHGSSPRHSMERKHMAEPTDALILQFLTWVGERPRCYGEAIEAWRTSCPRLTIWEDAISNGLVRIEGAHEAPMRQAKVVLTERGQALLAATAE